MCDASQPSAQTIAAFSVAAGAKGSSFTIFKGVMLYRIPHDGYNGWSLSGIAVQPSSHKGDVFATGSFDEGVLCIFDIRCSTTAPVIKTGVDGIIDVAFSPAVATHVAIAGLDGSNVIDIRQPDQKLLLLSVHSCDKIQYNSKGDRLIFLENSGLQVIDLLTFVSGNEDEGKKKILDDGQENNDWTTYSTCCFAGSHDELIVAASQDINIWSVPEGKFKNSTAGAAIEHLMRLPSQFVTGGRLCFSKERSTLISSAFGDTKIKVWTSFTLPLKPNS